mmetsp:Transcript_13247/g.57712  ORF Transcript_13247/g.57712 Transcript_13247/m.57712 type:complete len:292 (-) Transcript_13247:196-1071(-)
MVYYLTEDRSISFGPFVEVWVQLVDVSRVISLVVNDVNQGDIQTSVHRIETFDARLESRGDVEAPRREIALYVARHHNDTRFGQVLFVHALIRPRDWKLFSPRLFRCLVIIADVLPNLQGRIHVLDHVLGRRRVIRYSMRLAPFLDEPPQSPIGEQLCPAQLPPGVWAGSSVRRVDPSRHVRAIERGAARGHAPAHDRIVHDVSTDGAEEVLRHRRPVPSGPDRRRIGGIGTNHRFRPDAQRRPDPPRRARILRALGRRSVLDSIDERHLALVRIPPASHRPTGRIVRAHP